MTNRVVPRAYQHEACREMLAALRTSERILYVLPTGAGKTVVLGWLVQQWARAGARVLYVVHTSELVDQAYRTLVGAYGLRPADVGIVQGARLTTPAAPVQIATVQTLIRRTPPRADYVLVDEAHHAPADTWSRVLGWYGNARIVGVTATPERLDQTPLGRVFQRMLEGPGVEALIDCGWLRRPRCFVGFRVNAKGQRVRATRGRVLAGDIGRSLSEHGQDRNGVVFASSIAHAKRLTEELAIARWSSRLLTGQTPERERRAMLAPGGWLDKGARRLVITCDVLNEGYDLPSLKLAVLARRTHSQARYLHQVGRIMRPHVRQDGTEWSPIVLDHAGLTLDFGPPWIDRTWSLDRPCSDEGAEANGIADPHRPSPPRAKACPACGEVSEPGASRCPCGHVFPADRVPKSKTDVKLVELEPASAEQRAAYERDWYEASLARQMAAGLPRETAERVAREMAARATVMWFGKGEQRAA